MREDLELKEYAENLGWKCIYSRDDLTYKRNTPMEMLSFEKDNVHIWFCGGWRWDDSELFNGASHWVMKTWWQARNKENGVYLPIETRREYSTLKEALDTESCKT